MANADDQKQNSQPITIGPRDVLFECPACRKSLVVDESAEGMIVDCPQCRISIIVPPKNGVAPVKPPAAPPVPVPPVQAPPVVAPPETTKLPTAAREKLTVLAGKLKELQTQRTEVNNRLASRINEVNRDLVLLARLETSHQQILVEFNQVLSEMAAAAPAPDAAAGPATRTRVNFGG